MLAKTFDINSMVSEGAKLLGVGTEEGSAWEIPTNHSDPIDLVVGMPSPSHMPFASMSRLISESIESGDPAVMEYEYGRGNPVLRGILKDEKYGFTDFPSNEDQFILFNGSSGCMESFCATFVDHGDVVIVEGPSFPGTVETILKYRGEIQEVSIDSEGASIDRIQSIVLESENRGKRVKGLYVIPDFHNPVGVTMSLERRREIATFCLKKDILIVEDSTYSGLYFKSPPPPSLYSINHGLGVLRMGTFSKTIATGLRLGWMQGEESAIEAMRNTRADMGNAPFIQSAVAEFIRSGEFENHVRQMRLLYGKQCSALSDSLEEYCGDYMEFERTGGGFFLWPRAVEKDSMPLTRAAAEEGLIFPDGSLFYQDSSLHDNNVRMAFSGNSAEKLAEVGPRLRAAFERVLD